MIFPAIEVKIPSWNRILLERYTGMGEKGREGKKDLLLKQNWNSDEKKDCSIHAQMSTADLKLGLSYFPLLCTH